MYRPKDTNIYNWGKIKVRDYLQAFLDELSEKENNKVILNSAGEVIRIEGLLGIGALQYFKSLQLMHRGFHDWHEQELKFTASNLGRGYVAYFVCNRCLKSVKFLYYNQDGDNYFEQPLCRMCCGLKYAQPRRKQRRLSRLLNKDYLSTEHKYRLIKDTGITVQDVKDSQF